MWPKIVTPKQRNEIFLSTANFKKTQNTLVNIYWFFLHIWLILILNRVCNIKSVLLQYFSNYDIFKKCLNGFSECIIIKRPYIYLDNISLYNMVYISNPSCCSQLCRFHIRYSIFSHSLLLLCYNSEHSFQEYAAEPCKGNTMNETFLENKIHKFQCKVPKWSKCLCNRGFSHYNPHHQRP